MDLEYDELVRMIDNQIAASLERIEPELPVELWSVLSREIEWLRAP